jgi:hypothetical protein
MTQRILPRVTSFVSLSAIVASSLVFPVGTLPASAATPTECTTEFPPSEPAADGDGIRTILSEAELTWLASSQPTAAGAHFVLGEDLDLQGCVWPGAYWPAPKGGVEGFTGIFDGNGHTISGLLIQTGPTITDLVDQTAIGFFDVVNGSASIRNITFASPRLEVLSRSAGQTPSHYAIGIVAGALGMANTASPTLSNITVTDASVTMDCDVTTGCQVSTIGGVVGLAGRATISDVEISGVMNFEDTSQPVAVDGGGKELYIAPGSSSMTVVGMVAGALYESTTATRIRATGTISSMVGASTVGGLVGEISDAALSRGYSDVAITVGDSENNLPTQVTNVTNIGGAVGSIGFNTPAVDSVSSAGTITVRVAGFQENNPPTQTISQIGGLFGQVNDFATVSNARASGSISISAQDLGNTEADIRVSRIGGAVGEIGDSGGPSLTRTLALGGLSITADPTVTSTVVGALAGFAGIGVPVTGFWDSSAQTVPTSAAGTGKTPAELSRLDTYVNWSMVSGWVDNWSVGDPVWGLCEGLEGATPFLQWLAIEDPCVQPTPENQPAPQRPEARNASSPGWFTLGPVTLSFPAVVGQETEGTAVAASGEGMQSGSSVDMEVRSTPVTLSRVGVDSAGHFTATGSLPRLPAGDHRLLIDGVDSSGSPWLITVSFGVDSAGMFSWVGEPSLTNPAQLAKTGGTWPSTTFFLAGLVLVLAGVLAVTRTRRSITP